MGEHPIDGLMKTAMESIKDMVDVNTIVGDAVQAHDGTVIIPVSKVSFGFAAGGGEYTAQVGEGKHNTSDDEDTERNNKFPFAGGSGAGVTISPVAFMVVGQSNTIKLLPVDNNTQLDKVVEFIPQFVEKLSEVFGQKKPYKDDEGLKIERTIKQQET